MMRIKKTAVFVIIFGFVFFVIGAYFGFQEYRTVSEERSITQIITIGGFYSNWLLYGIFVFFGLLIFIIGIRWFMHSVHKHTKISHLKKYGQRVQAYFLRQESSEIRINNQEGVILYFQEKDGTRVFKTHPIFSTSSIKWLEEHVFDIYVGARDKEDYYIDLEKHFGEPRVYRE